MNVWLHYIIFDRYIRADVTWPRTQFDTLKRFNWSDPVQRETARLYRNAEVPFVLRGVPDVDATVARWTDKYLSDQVCAAARAARS